MDNFAREGEQGLTPQQQNKRLKDIFLSYMPFKDNRDISLEEQTTDSSSQYPEFPSEYSRKFSEKIRSIISTAPITDSFKDYIVEGTGLLVQIGWPSERKREELLEFPDLFFLDSKNLESGGIFDKKRASQLERRAIGEQIMRMVPSETKRSEEFLKKMGEELGSGEEFGKRFKSGMKEAAAQTAGRWRRQFKENYGEEL